MGFFRNLHQWAWRHFIGSLLAECRFDAKTPLDRSAPVPPTLEACPPKHIEEFDHKALARREEKRLLVDRLYYHGACDTLVGRAVMGLADKSVLGNVRRISPFSAECLLCGKEFRSSRVERGSTTEWTTGLVNHEIWWHECLS